MEIKVPDFSSEVEQLSAQKLREAYPKESNSHRGMMSRQKSHGMTIAPSWRDFRTFLKDMGPIPGEGWTLDRIDPFRREYGPGLCRWADKKTQSENRTNTKWVTTNDSVITAAEFIRQSGLPKSTVYAAVAAGKSVEEIQAPKHISDFRPTGIPDLKEWLSRYEKWFRNEVHSAKRPYAPPEVFELILVSLQMKEADDELTSIGYYELSGEQVEAAQRIESSIAYSQWQDGRKRQSAALEHLETWNPRLTKRLTGQAGFTSVTFWKWATFLKAPPMS